MTERTLTPADFIDRKFCDWFILTKVKSGPEVRYACKMCGRISKTKMCLAFDGAETKPSPAT